ncbi:MAG: heavy metal-responsive transcriptional regulator [Planctomycetes bacterium]|nr:heavy metal-responsive transcriptional regulator [Planctomycetota bacterium]
MIKSYTIGELARRAEVPTSTVRYYERAGLLRPAGRTASNYRFYGEDAFERLRFIRTAQAAGFTLGDITSLLELRDGTAVPCREVQVLIEARVDDVAKQLEDLQHVQEVLHASLHICREAEAKGRCEVMENLKLVSATPTSRTARRGGKNNKS